MIANNYPGDCLPIILIHGGADIIPESLHCPKKEGIKKSVAAGYRILENGGSSLDAVEAAVRSMEENDVFNCGRGSMLNERGEVEMDASIMNGSDLAAGAVASVKNVLHPVSLAKLVMEKTPHVSLVGEGAMLFAKLQGVPEVKNQCLVTEFALSELERAKKHGYENPISGGTTGAVAIDKNGHLAAATSTGGLPGKMLGRIGDTPIIGSGTYADDCVGAVSVTGHGESIAKLCVAHTIIKDMENGKNPCSATWDVLKKIHNRFQREAGAITLSRNGEIGFGFTSNTMPWAYRRGDEIHYGLLKGEHLVENAVD